MPGYGEIGRTRDHVIWEEGRELGDTYFSSKAKGIWMQKRGWVRYQDT